LSSALFGPLAGVASRLGRFWWALLVAGVTWLAIGLIVLRFDTATVAVVSVVFGILVLVSAAGEAFRAAVSGVVVLVTWVSVTAVFRGVAEIAAAFTIRGLGHART
jgi:uncharacterized membrane protein HdeD (DUF308 family)